MVAHLFITQLKLTNNNTIQHQSKFSFFNVFYCKYINVDVYCHFEFEMCFYFSNQFSKKNILELTNATEINSYLFTEQEPVKPTMHGVCVKVLPPT